MRDELDDILAKTVTMLAPYDPYRERMQRRSKKTLDKLNKEIEYYSEDNMMRRRRTRLDSFKKHDLKKRADCR